MAKRRVHLGIDYGTSASKMVLRDYGAPGGERATVVTYGSGYRVSSTVALKGGEVLLEFDPTTHLNRSAGDRLYQSIKMRVAGEASGGEERYCFAPEEELPAGLTAKDLATLTVWRLISVGAEAAEALAGQSELALGMTLGVPMGFYTDKKLQGTFLQIARCAWYLYRHIGSCKGTSIGVERAASLLADARAAVSQTEVPANQVRDWIRPEAEAAMYWAFQSPAVPSGPYAKVDIGAGTTNASVFRKVDAISGGQWIPKKLAFFGAYSHAVGMDVLDEALARYKGLPEGEQLKLRGQEDRILSEDAAASSAKGEMERIARAFDRAWMDGFSKYRASTPEVDAWRKGCRVFLIGGGSLVARLREVVARVPQSPSVRLLASTVEQPPDLVLPRGVGSESLPFLLVAYGLSALGLAIPEAHTPDEVPPITDAGQRLHQLELDDIYAK